MYIYIYIDGTSYNVQPVYWWQASSVRLVFGGP